MSGFITAPEPTESGILESLIPLNLSFEFSKTEIGLLTLDVMFSEKIVFEGKVTQYPVEDGTTISDHITQGSRTLQISGTRSASEAYVFNFGSKKTRLIDALLLLQKMHEERKLLTVTTGLAVYKDLGIENMTATRSNNQPRDGNWLDFDIQLRHIRKVTLRTAEVPPEKTSNNNGTRRRTGNSNNPSNSANNATPSQSANGNPNGSSLAVQGDRAAGTGLYDRFKAAIGGR